MEMFLKILLLVVGFAMLVKGADFFVDGAAGLAGKLKVPELVIGLTIVAFGTSAPELSVSITSAADGSSGISVGNVIGSNITNILLILGITSIVRAVPVQKSSLKLDIPFLLVVSAAFVLVGYIGSDLTRAEGIVMFIFLIAYVVALVILALRERKKALMSGEELKSEVEQPKSKIGIWYKSMCQKWWFLLILIAAGLAAVVFGADFVVDGATYLATQLGVSERVIGLTIVAVGTSLPELVTSVTAAAKGNTDIAVGNIIGSNIFNILCVAGLSAAITPLVFSEEFVIDGIIAAGAAAILALFCYLPGHTLKRWHGIIMLAGFAGYYVYLFAL